MWLLTAGVIAKIGTGFSRWADGMKINFLKTGENKNRAFAMAQEMGITLRRVFVVPAGKGRLTNAFGSRDSIGLTDNLGKYLTREQIRFVIAHELSHVKLRHARKQFFFVIGIYSFLALALFILGPFLRQFPPLYSFVIVLFPLLFGDWFSRKLEYEADRQAFHVIQDPETAIRALARLLKSNDLPPQRGSLSQIFMSHPFFLQRARAIAKAGDVSTNRLNRILAEECVGSNVS